MQIFLLILKVLGILILLILGILILLLCLVLFIPVRYQIEGNVEEDFVFSVKGKISWFLSALSISFSYEDSELLQEIRILGIKRKEREKNTEESEEALDEGSEEPAESDLKDEEPEITYSEKQLKRLEEKQKAKEETEHFKDSLQREEAEESSKKQSSEISRKSWIYKQFDKIRKLFVDLKIRVEKFFELLKNIKGKISDIKVMITDETNKRAVALLWKEVRYLLRHFKFRKIDTDLTFGTDDPATTGQALGIISMFPILYQYQFRLYPDFEADKLYVKGTFKISGRARSIHLLISLIRFIREKDVRSLLKKLLDKN